MFEEKTYRKTHLMNCLMPNGMAIEEIIQKENREKSYKRNSVGFSLRRNESGSKEFGLFLYRLASDKLSMVIEVADGFVQGAAGLPGNFTVAD